MDQNDNRQNDFLYALLANPAADASTYVNDLQRLVDDNPQSGLLQALLAHASDEKNLKQASAYFNSRLLYKLINNPAGFRDVDPTNINIHPQLKQNGNNKTTAVFHLKAETDDPVPESAVHDHPVFASPSAHPDEAHSANNTREITPAEDTDVAEHTLDEQLIADKENSENIPPVSLHETNGVEFHPGLENITLFEDANATPADSNPTDETLAEKQTSNTEAVDITNDPVYIIEKEKEDNSLVAGSNNGVNHEAPVEINEDFEAKPEAIKPPADTTVVNNLNPEAPAEDTYSGAGRVEESGIEDINKLTPELTQEEPVAQTDNASAEANGEAVKEIPQSTDIDDDVYDEITGIENIQLNNTAKIDEQTVSMPVTDTEEDKLIIENIAATDFFMFDDAFGNHRAEDKPVSKPELDEPAVSPVTPVAEEPEAVISAPAEPEASLNLPKEEQQDVSKYNDDKMPYTFMWWLDKTRREHAGVSQPYAEKPQPEVPAEKQADDVLQQQYYSNIFHISSIEELTKDKPAQPFSFGIKNRSLQIIEKFIKEEPQIRPQSSDKLDNENKAKKSSEDRDEIVTETLAAIYAEQMLYYKAIAAYKKLMLKFPEKSSFFADKIEQLNKKIN